MKIYKIALFSFPLLVSPLWSQDFTVSVQALADPTGFLITPGSNLSLRVAQQVPSVGANTSTHILIEGLSPIESGSTFYASNYRGINSVSGAEQDLGVLFLQLPESSGLPEGTVSSPIVGVVQRSGSWDGYSLAVPSTSVGGASGQSSADSGAGTINATLVRGGETFTGTIPYTVLDTDTIELDPFILVKDGVTSIPLSGAIMMRDGLRFYGTITNLSSGAAYDSLLFALEFSNIPDVDGDGIPDLTDDFIGGGGLLVGEWSRIDFTWIYGLTAEWGITTYMSYIWVPYLPYVYQVNNGWMYYFSSNGTDHILYDWDLGWLYVNEGNGGWYTFFRDGTWQWGNFANSKP